MIKCPLTGSSNVRVIYEQRSVPLIQNKVYPSKEEARAARCIDVTLAQSLDNGFVFSANFDDSIIDYDAHYQNEQSNSDFFKRHLENVISIMQEHRLLDGKVVEIGCGKAYFMNMLLEKGVDVIGFDPTYEGDSPKVVKDFFSDKYSDIAADFIILRHTMEHISHPFDFIKTIAAANNNKGKIFIEVPTFDWIAEHNATEDIFYEHCNYFTLDTLSMFFENSTGGSFFNGQYIYLIADLKDVKETIGQQPVKEYEVTFTKKLEEYEKLIGSMNKVAVWGAGAKGSTFLNLLD
ncbi:MAG: class I SAM-dependent methyltransferase, partial [Sphingobacteriales bacterium]